MGIYAEAVRARAIGWGEVPEALAAPVYLIFSTRSVARSTLDACLGPVAAKRVLTYGDGPADSPEIVTERLRPDAGSVDKISSFAEDAAGNLYIIDLDGEIFRLTVR